MRITAPESDSTIFSKMMRPRNASIYAPMTSWFLALPLIATFSLGFAYPVSKLVMLSFSRGVEDYARIGQDPLYLRILVITVIIAAIVTALCLVLGYPVAIVMARFEGKVGLAVAACVFLSLWTSILIRSYAWIVLLERNGTVNDLLQEIGVVSHPLKLLYTQGAVILGMTHILMPFAILPIYATLRTLPADYGRAAANLGAGPIANFVLITFPLSLPGVFAGGLLCFVLALGFYITPALLGGPGSMLMATLIGQQTTVLLDWPFAAALSTVLLCVTLLFVFVFRKALSFSKGFHSVA